MPTSYHMELTKLLLSRASGNTRKADEIGSLIEDVWDNLMAKLQCLLTPL